MDNDRLRIKPSGFYHFPGLPQNIYFEAALPYYNKTMKNHSSKTLRLVIPSRTRTVSVTGSACALNCLHCGGRYLQSMETPEEFLQRGPRRYTSVLLSGGMNQKMWVPWDKKPDFLRRIGQWNLKINVHTGLMPPHRIEAVNPYASAYSFDLVTDEKTIEEVYGVRLSGERFLSVYDSLRRSRPTVPHITVGLWGGRIRGEYEALEELAKRGAERIVFLILVPTGGTAFQSCSPPAPESVEKLLAKARELMPQTSFTLGCMHPRGSYGEKLESICIGLGFDTVVMPSARLRSGNSSHSILEKQECCIL